MRLHSFCTHLNSSLKIASVLSIVFVVAVPQWASAQTQLDISACFNSLLQQQTDYSSDVRLALATLSQISESNYESSKHDASLSGEYKFLSASLDYSDFNEKRRQYFELNKLDLNYYRSVSLKTRTLDSRAYGVIKSCIDKVAADQYGFHYLYTVDDEKTASVQLFWKPTEGGGPIAVTDSTLLNAKAKTDGVPDGKLFPYVSRWNLSSYPKISGPSPVVLLERTDVTKNINCTITTKPQVRTYDIVIPPLKKPIIDLTCNTVYETVDPAKGKPYFGQESLPLNITDLHGCSDCHGYFLTIDAPGPVIDVACVSSGDHVWQEICDSQDRHIRAIGYENANPRSMYISYHYKVARQVCSFPNADDQHKAAQGKGSVKTFTAQ